MIVYFHWQIENFSFWNYKRWASMFYICGAAYSIWWLIRKFCNQLLIPFQFNIVNVHLSLICVSYVTQTKYNEIMVTFVSLLFTKPYQNLLSKWTILICNSSTHIIFCGWKSVITVNINVLHIPLSLNRSGIWFKRCYLS